jgi:hypothetical protein
MNLPGLHFASGLANPQQGLAGIFSLLARATRGFAHAGSFASQGFGRRHFWTRAAKSIFNSKSRPAAGARGDISREIFAFLVVSGCNFGISGSINARSRSKIDLGSESGFAGSVQLLKIFHRDFAQYVSRAEVPSKPLQPASQIPLGMP